MGFLTGRVTFARYRVTGRRPGTFGAEQLGYSVDELVGRSVLDVFYPADRSAIERNAAITGEKTRLRHALSGPHFSGFDIPNEQSEEAEQPTAWLIANSNESASIRR